MEDSDEWADYESQMLFPGCDCPHQPFSHAPAWGQDQFWQQYRPDSDEEEGCALCPCPVEWEHA